MDYIERNKELWEKHFMNIRLDYPNEEVVRFLAKCKHIYEQGVMLDWGCATGRHTVLGCKFGFQVYAADYVENCVKITKEKVEKECRDMQGRVVDYIVNKDVDIECLQDETLDIVLAWGCIFYNDLDGQREMIKNIYRMLKKGGRAFCDFRTHRDSIYTNSNIGKEVGKESFTLESETKSLEGAFMSLPSLEELKEMFIDAGFEIENIELNEFTQENQKILNSWWHVTVIKK